MQMALPLEVEQIIGRRVYSGKVMYLVKWKDFPLSDATWECIKVLKHAKPLIKRFNEEQKSANGCLDNNSDDIPGKRTRKPKIEHTEGSEKTEKSKGKRGRKPRQAKATQKVDLEVKDENELYFDDCDAGNDGNSLNEKEENEKEEASTDQSQQDSSEHMEKPAKAKEEQACQVKIEAQEQQKVEVAERSLAECAGGIQRIALLKVEDGRFEYEVQLLSGMAVRCESSELLQRFPVELVRFLEHQLVARMAK